MKKPLTVVFLTPHDLPSAHISRNFDYARRLVKSGHRVIVMVNNYSHREGRRIHETPGGYYHLTEVDGIAVVWLNTNQYQNSKLKRGINAISYLGLALLYAYRHLDKPDVFIGDSVPPTAGLAAYLASCIMKARFVYQIRDVWPEELVSLGVIRRNGLIYHVLRALEILLFRRADRIYSALPLIDKHVRQTGASTDKIVYLPNGVDLGAFPYRPYEPIESNPVKLVYAGGFGYAHDVETILKAIGMLRADGLNLVLEVYGSGGKLESIVRLSQQLSLDNVKFMGSVEKSIVPVVLAEADILIAAVTKSDVYKFGVNVNKIYDYMAASRPIVMAITAPTTPIERAGCGFVVPPEDPISMADAIRSIYGMTVDERRALGSKARSYVENHYDVDKLAIIYESNLPLE